MKHSLLTSFVVSILSVGTLAACGGGGKTSSTTEAPRAAGGDPSCPVSVPGTSVTVEDTNTGAALVFVTTGDVAELRKRVAAMAKMHNDHHGSMGALPDGKDAGGGHAGHDMSKMGSGSMQGHDMSNMGSGDDMSQHAGHAGAMISVHSKAESADVERGAKLVLTVGAADVAKLQSELRMHAQHLSNGTCAMEHH
jgi:hypothetical protein